jgi:hypothetical protein
MVNNPPRRENARPQHIRRSGIVSSADIEAAVKASGIPDDSETTGPTGIRRKAIDEGKKDPKIKHLYGE